MTDELDFSKINQEKIGYALERNEYYKDVKFGDFILPYSHKTESYQKVYERLGRELDNNLGHLEFLLKQERPIMLDITANSALERERIRNAMDLIKKNYL